MRRTLTTALFLFAAPFLHAIPQQSAAAKTAEPTFQVATIKPSSPDSTYSMVIDGRRYATHATTVVDILKYSYGVHADQIVDAPAWVASDRFDVLADPDAQTRPSSDQFKSMVRSLLAERFHLTVHHETRTLPAYVIQTTAKNGPFKPGSSITPNTGAPGIPSPGYRVTGEFSAKNASLTDVATFLQRYVLDRPVVDQTHLPGCFDLTLKWTPDEGQFNGHAVLPRSDSPDALPSLYTAFQEQLGLRLVATRAPIDVLVIDHIEQPSAN